jgi:hypothetical protein
MTYLEHLTTLTPRVDHWREQGPDLTDKDLGIERCVHCGDVWHFESEQPLAEWSRFHAGCAEAPCSLCGQPTNTPDACFECYHSPFGVGWEREYAESNGF